MSKLKDRLTDQTGQFGKNWAEKTVKNKWLILIISILFVVACMGGMKNFSFNNDYHVFFSDDNPQLKAFDNLQAKYTDDDNVLLVIEPEDGNVFKPKTLELIQETVDSAWFTPFVTRVDGISNYQHTRSEGDDLYVEDLIADDPNALSSSEIANIKSIATNEILLKNRLIGERGNITAVNITVRLPELDSIFLSNPELTEEDIAKQKMLVMNANTIIAKDVQELADYLEKAYPGHKTYLTGTVMLSDAFQQASQRDMGTLYPLMFLIIFLTIIISARTITGSVATLLVIFFSIFIAFGIFFWFGGQMTGPTTACMVIITTLAVADSIHILITFRQNMIKGLTKKEAIIESLRVNFLPVFLTSLTTVIGFLSLNFSDAPPFRDQGNITAIGMTAAFFLSTTFLPALMVILPSFVKVKKTDGEEKKLPFVERFAEWVISNEKKVLWGSIAAMLVLSLPIVKNEINDEFVKYFAPSIKFRTDTDAVSDKLTGIYSAEFSVGAGEADGINSPEYLTQLERFDTWLKEQPEVTHVNSYIDIAKRVNKSMHGDSLEYYKIPTTRQEAAQYLLLYELSLPQGLDVNNQINVDKSETRVTATIQNLTTQEMIDFTERSENWLKENTPESMHALGSSATMMFAHLGFRQIYSSLKGNVFAIILITLALIIALRSVKYGLLSMIPNLIPILVGFGIWGLMDARINLGLSAVFSMTLGIIVDDTVHFLSKYLRARRELNYDSPDAVRYAFSTVGRALLVTTFVLIAGFAVLSTSSFGFNALPGRVTLIIISLALVFDFLLLPALLLAVGKKGN